MRISIIVLTFAITFAMCDLSNKWKVTLIFYITIIVPLTIIIGETNDFPNNIDRDDIEMLMTSAMGGLMYTIFFYLFANSYD